MSRVNLEANQVRKARHRSTTFGIAKVVLTGPLTIPDDGPSIWFLDCNGATRTVFLPRLSPYGGQYYVLINSGTVGSFNVNYSAENGSGSVATGIAPNAMIKVFGSDTAWKADITGDITAAIANLQGQIDALDTRTDALETADVGLDSRLDALEIVTGTQSTPPPGGLQFRVGQQEAITGPWIAASTPFTIIASGQSNMRNGTATLAQGYVPAPNVRVWNNLLEKDILEAGGLGTAFTALPATGVFAHIWASEIARHYPMRTINLIVAAYGGKHIGFWLDQQVSFNVANNSVVAARFYPNTATIADSVRFFNQSGTATLPSPLTFNTTYFAKTALSDGEFTLSLTDQGSQITLSGAASGTIRMKRVPDNYRTLADNVNAALDFLGYTGANKKVDAFVWWQGENQRMITQTSSVAVSPLTHTYSTEFEQFVTRLKTESWFLPQTPIVIHGVAPHLQSSTGVGQPSPARCNTDVVNVELQKCARADPDNRIYVNQNPALVTGSADYDDTLHVSGQGYVKYAKESSKSFLGHASQVGLIDPVGKKLNVQVLQRTGARNFWIGGDFSTNPWQRGFPLQGTAGASFFAADKTFYYSNLGTSAIAAQVTKVADSPAASMSGFVSSQCLEVSALASGALQTNDCVGVCFKMEACMWSQTCWPSNPGQPNTSPLTLSFWVKSDTPGIYYVRMGNSTNTSATRHMFLGYIIDVANTWEKKILTFNPDPTGPWQQATQGVLGCEIMLVLACNSNLISATAEQWNAGGAAFAGPGQVNALSAVGKKVRFALMQLEEGRDASEFEKEDPTITLLRCQRYFAKSFPVTQAPAPNAGNNGAFAITSFNAIEGAYNLRWPVPMMANPAVFTLFNPGSANSGNGYGVVTGAFRDVTNGADRNGIGVDVSPAGITLLVQSPVANARNLVHYTAFSDF